MNRQICHENAISIWEKAKGRESVSVSEAYNLVMAMNHWVKDNISLGENSVRYVHNHDTYLGHIQDLGEDKQIFISELGDFACFLSSNYRCTLKYDVMEGEYVIEVLPLDEEGQDKTLERQRYKLGNWHTENNIIEFIAQDFWKNEINIRETRNQKPPIKVADVPGFFGALGLISDFISTKEKSNSSLRSRKAPIYYYTLVLDKKKALEKQIEAASKLKAVPEYKLSGISGEILDKNFKAMIDLLKVFFLYASHELNENGFESTYEYDDRRFNSLSKQKEDGYVFLSSNRDIMWGLQETAEFEVQMSEHSSGHISTNIHKRVVDEDQDKGLYFTFQRCITPGDEEPSYSLGNYDQRYPGYFKDHVEEFERFLELFDNYLLKVLDSNNLNIAQIQQIATIQEAGIKYPEGHDE